MASPRLIFGLYGVLFVGIATGAGLLFAEAGREYRRLHADEVANRRRLAEVEAELARQKLTLERLRTDPAYVEKILRQRTYARPEDAIFRFEN